MSFDLYTQCPGCGTVFRITQTQLGWAKGKVRCGECQTVFQAMEHLADKPGSLGGAAEQTKEETEEEPGEPAALASVEPEPRPAAQPEAAAVPTTPAAREHRPERSAAPPPTPQPAVPAAAAAAPADLYDALPEHLRPAPRRGASPLGSALWSLGILTLSVIFVLQYAYFSRDQLAQHPELRPWLERLCALADCTIPLRKDIAAIQLRSRDVRTHPTVQNALLIDARLINGADFPQPFPDMQLTLSTLQGQVVAARRFAPSEYLSKLVDIGQGMPPGAPIHIELELADPGQEAINFEFEFLQP